MAGASACAGRTERFRWRESTGAHAIGEQPKRHSAASEQRRSASRRRAACVSSPAVGYFVPRDGSLGSASRSDVAIPSAMSTCWACARRSSRRIDGVIGALDVEAGQAIEYGQPVARVDAPPVTSRAGIRHQGRSRCVKPDVQQDPHRQSRRDRRCASCARAARLGIASVVAYSEADRDSRAVQLADEAICVGPAESRAQLPVRAGHPVGRPRHRLRGDPSGLRLPVRGRHVRRDDARPRPDLHRAAARGAGALRLEGRHAHAAGQARPAHDPRLGHAARRRPRAGRGGAHRLPGAHQAIGRWRRQGHAHGPLAARAAAGDDRLPLRGTGRVRRRLALPREVARGEPPRRGPGHRRSLRQRRPRRRARLLRPAPPPEDPRGGAHRRRSTTADAQRSPSRR